MKNWYLIYKEGELYGRTYSDCKAGRYSSKPEFTVEMIRTQKMGETRQEHYVPWGER